MKKGICIFILFLFFVVVVRGSSIMVNSKGSGLSYNWVDATMNGYEVVISRYRVSEPIKLSYAIRIKDTEYNWAIVSKDGWVGFAKERYNNIENLFSDMSLQPQQDKIEVIITALPFGGIKAKKANVYVLETKNYIAIEWVNWYANDEGESSKFEILISPSGLVKIQYEYLEMFVRECDMSVITYSDYNKGVKCEETGSNFIKAPMAFSIGEDEKEILLGNCNFLPYVFCNQPLSQQSTGVFSGNSLYNCSANEYNGAEKMYILNLTEPTNIKIKISNFDSRQLDLFLLSACSYDSCIVGGADVLSIDNLNAGIYYIAVDGLSMDDNGTFDLQVTCNNISCNDVIEIN